MSKESQIEQFWEVRSTTTVILRARVKAKSRAEAKEKAAMAKMDVASERLTLSANSAYDQWSAE